MSGFQTTIIQGKTNHLDVDLMAIVKDLFDGNSGIVNTSDLLVTQSDPLAMSVTVPAGVIYHYISSAASYYRHKLADAATVLNIDANSSGSTRYDLVCVKTDLTATPDADGYGVATPLIVKGTPGGGVPSTPANHYKIAEVEVDDGASSIANAKITDRRTMIQFAKVDTDGTLAANSNSKIASQKAVKTYSRYSSIYLGINSYSDTQILTEPVDGGKLILLGTGNSFNATLPAVSACASGEIFDICSQAGSKNVIRAGSDSIYKYGTGGDVNNPVTSVALTAPAIYRFICFGGGTWLYYIVS